MALPVSYHWRSLFVRKLTTLLTLLVVAAVVGVLTWMVGFAESLHRSMATAHDDHKIVVLRGASTAESNSALTVENVHTLTGLSNLLDIDPHSGEPLISPEVMVQVQLQRVGDKGKTLANVAVRGVTEKAFLVHRNIKPLGQTFKPGSREVIVGEAAAKQFMGLEIGSTIELGYGGDRGYTIVGHFSAAGGPMESEIWAYGPSLMDSYSRSLYSSASLRIPQDADPALAIAQIEGPAIQLSARTERSYWEEQSSNVRKYLVICYILVAVMCLAAIFAIANTMFAMVAGRTREIGMLRTIGFSGGSICWGFILEACILSLIGGVLGCLGCLAWLETVGKTKDMFGANTFTTMAFTIEMTPGMILTALAVVLAVAFIGAGLPALRGARLNVVTAMREA